MRLNARRKLGVALQSLPQRRDKGNDDEKGLTPQHGVELDEAEVHQVTDGTSGTVAEMKTRVSGSGRSFIRDILSCLVDDSCRAEVQESNRLEPKLRRPMSFADGGHREHRHLQLPKPKSHHLHPHHRQRSTVAVEDVDRFLLLQLNGRHAGAPMTSGVRRLAYHDGYDHGNGGGGRATPTMVVGHRQACHRREAEETRCLNGGQCFAVEFHSGLRRSGCSCVPSWSGLRCEERYVDPSQWDFAEESIKMASAGYSTTFLVLMLFLVWLLQYMVTRRKKTPRQQWDHLFSPRGHATKLHNQVATDADGDIVGLYNCFDDSWKKLANDGENSFGGTSYHFADKIKPNSLISVLHRTSASMSLIISVPSPAHPPLTDDSRTSRLLSSKAREQVNVNDGDGGGDLKVIGNDGE